MRTSKTTMEMLWDPASDMAFNVTFRNELKNGSKESGDHCVVKIQWELPLIGRLVPSLASSLSS